MTRWIGTLAGVCAISASLLGARPASATTTRVWTLGGMNRFILDDANRWLFPHVITKYGDLFYLELFGANDSISATAPTSERGMNDRTAAQALAGGNGFVSGLYPSYATIDMVPVQQTAGGGAIIAVTDDLFISLHLSDYENPLITSFLDGPFAAHASTMGAVTPSNPSWLTSGTARAVSSANRKFDFFAAYRVPDLASFGLLLTYGSSKYNRNPNSTDPPLFAGNDQQARATDNLGAQELRFLVSGGVDIGEEIAIDAAFGMGFHSLTYLPNNDGGLLDGGGGNDLQADVRAMIGLTERWEIVPAISIRSGGLEGKDLADFSTGLKYNNSDTGSRSMVNITDVKVSWFNFDLGVAAHFKPTDFIDFWGATGFQIIRANSQDENTIPRDPSNGVNRTNDPYEFQQLRLSGDVTPYIRMGLEARIFSWLDFRGGVVKYLRADTISETKTDDQNSMNNLGNDFTRDFPFFDYFIGAAVHYDGFFLDMQVDPNWFKRGPNFLSGAPMANMFINASLGYRF
jgi:hypothetical protein